MSVYSGFSTRQQETVYHQLTESLLSLFQERVLGEIGGQAVNAVSWEARFLEIFYQMGKLETSKYLPPKLTLSVRDLAQHYVTLRKQSLTLPTLSPIPLSPISETALSHKTSKSPLKAPMVTQKSTSLENSGNAQTAQGKGRTRGIKLARIRSKRLTPELRGRMEAEWTANPHISQRYYSRLMLKRMHEDEFSLFVDSQRSILREGRRKATS